MQERLQRRRERERQARARETAEEREVRLQKRRERERQARAEEREVRLQRRRERERQARARETAEEPDAEKDNDGMIIKLSNSFNPIQLSTWRVNVDMQFIVSRRRVIDYCTKYITKSEPRSETPLTRL